MERIDQLEQEVRSLSLGVRIGLAVIVIVFALQCCALLSVVPVFREVLNDLMEGARLPLLTTLVLEFAQPVFFGVIAMALIAVAVLFVFPRQSWCIPVGVLAAILMITIMQAVVFAVQMPLLTVSTKLGQ